MRDQALDEGHLDDSRGQSLLDRARDEEAALTQLLELYRRFLGHIAREEIGPQLAAKVAPSDVAQDVIVIAYKEFASFRTGTIRSFKAWLRTLLRNHLSDERSRYTDTQKRQIRREVSIQDLDSHVLLEQLATDEAHSPSAIVASQDDKRRIEVALAKLPPHYQEVIRLRSLESLDFAEVGRRMEIEENRTRALWGRAVAKLREIMNRPAQVDANE